MDGYVYIFAITALDRFKSLFFLDIDFFLCSYKLLEQWFSTYVPRHFCVPSNCKSVPPNFYHYIAVLKLFQHIEPFLYNCLTNNSLSDF